MGPRLTHQDTHGAFDDVKDVVLGVRMRARTLRMWLKPPFRDRVARFAFGSVGLEDRGDAAHWIGTSLPGTENHSLARWGARFIHPSICWRGGHVQASDENKMSRADEGTGASGSVSARELSHRISCGGRN